MSLRIFALTNIMDAPHVDPAAGGFTQPRLPTPLLEDVVPPLVQFRVKLLHYFPQKHHLQFILSSSLSHIHPKPRCGAPRSAWLADLVLHCMFRTISPQFIVTEGHCGLQFGETVCTFLATDEENASLGTTINRSSSVQNCSSEGQA